MNFLNLKTSFIKPQHLALWLVVVFGFVFCLYVFNNILAFTGVHKVTISSFAELPKSVVYSGSAEIGVVSTPNGKVNRPYTDQVKFAVTLPRGFDTMTMTAEVDADPFATVTLGAKVPINAPDQSASFRNPAAYSAEWRSLQLGQGSLYVKNHPEIENVDAFWNNFAKLKNIYSIGEDLKDSIPTSFYAPNAESPVVQLPGGYRGSFHINAYFDGKPQQVSFDTKVAYSTTGKNTLRTTLEHQGKIVIAKDIADGGRALLRHVLNIPASDPGFYTLRFVANSEATVVNNIQFRGDAVELSNMLFLDQSASAVTLYTKCTELTVVAVHQAGAQYPVNVNGKQVKLLGVKQSQKIPLKSGINTLVFPRADVGLSNTCGFLLQPDSTLRAAFEKISGRIIVVPQFKASTLEVAEYIYDPVPAAPILSKKNGTYTIAQTFDLHTLSAKGKTFTFSLSAPGFTSRPGAYLHVKRISFTARRPAFRLSDISKAVDALIKKTR